DSGATSDRGGGPAAGGVRTHRRHPHLGRPAPMPSDTPRASSHTPLGELEHAVPFRDRHVGPSADDQAKMLAFLGFSSLDDVSDQTLPPAIRSDAPLALDDARSEPEVLAELHDLAARNRPMVQMIGLGYHGTVTP